MEEKNPRYFFGMILTLCGGILGLTLHILFFLNWYQPLIEAEQTLYPTLTNYRVITYMLPVFTDFGILAAILYLMSAFAFVRKMNIAYALAVVANTLAIHFSFWPMIPALDCGLTPIYIFIFLPNLVLFFLLHLGVGKRPITRVLVGLISGMGFVTAFINGTASLNLYWMKHLPFYLLANRMHWIVALAFGVITIGMFLFPKDWIPTLGFGISILELVLGGPMGVQTTLVKGEFSMYLAAPFLSLLLLIVFLSPKLWKALIKPEKTAEVGWKI